MPEENDTKVVRQDSGGNNLTGLCLCPNCGYREEQQLTVPCYNKKCPKCGSPMSRG